MRLCIGENIRRLRRERDLTQEELAEQLGVSCQSVSRWENGACYPDVELIPDIAVFFGVSADRLMGLDESREEDQVNAVLDEFQQAISRGAVERCIGIARAGLKAHPGSYALMNKLMYALFVAGDDTGNIPDWKENMQRYDEEITRLGERIMKHCPDQKIRLEAMARLAFNHCELGRKKQGREIYEQLPGMENTRETQIWWALEPEEKPANAREIIWKSWDLMDSGCWQLINSGALSDEEQETVVRLRFDVRRLVCGENPPPSNGQARIGFAVILARQGKTDAALEQLRLAAEQAKAFDARPECGTWKSPVLGERQWKRSDYETADDRPVAQIMRDYWLKRPDFEKLRDLDAFREIENML